MDDKGREILLIRLRLHFTYQKAILLVLKGTDKFSLGQAVILRWLGRALTVGSYGGRDECFHPSSLHHPQGLRFVYGYNSWLLMFPREEWHLLSPSQIARLEHPDSCKSIKQIPWFKTGCRPVASRRMKIRRSFYFIRFLAFEEHGTR